MIRPNINVTPLIDVLLVLLIIFMVISPLAPSQIETKIPQPPDLKSPALPNDQTLRVTVSRDETIAVNETLSYDSFRELPRLTTDLKKVLKRRVVSNPADRNSGSAPGRTVFVKAPKSMPYGRVVKVLDAVKLAGATPLSLQIDSLD